MLGFQRFVRAKRHHSTQNAWHARMPHSNNALLIILAIALCIATFSSQSYASTINALPPVQVNSLGPPVWVVRYHSDTMYIIGSISPLSKSMDWSEKDVRLLLSGAKALILPVRLAIYRHVSLIREAKLDWLERYRWPYNSNGRTLRTLLDDKTYRLWKHTWQKYGGNSPPPDKLRPYYAFKLVFHKYERAHNLSEKYLSHLLRSIGGHYSLQIKSPTYVWRVPHAQATWLTMTQFSQHCFYNSLKTLNGDYSVLYWRAKAWSVGNMSLLQRLGFSANVPACQRDSKFFRAHGFPDVPKHAGKWWAHYVISAMRKYKIIVDVEPIWSLENGMLTHLSALGATVVAPKLQGTLRLKQN